MAGKTHKVIVYDAPDTPYYRTLFRQGLKALNDLIDEFEAQQSVKDAAHRQPDRTRVG
ncbi:MAG: hypothetical protein HQP61_02410 [Peptococcaceae bacterium]|nr:hypothetical protein [Candidatus Syntrophopropionicum ammoniitolerans]